MEPDERALRPVGARIAETFQAAGSVFLALGRAVGDIEADDRRGHGSRQTVCAQTEPSHPGTHCASLRSKIDIKPIPSLSLRPEWPMNLFRMRQTIRIDGRPMHEARRDEPQAAATCCFPTLSAPNRS